MTLTTFTAPPSEGELKSFQIIAKIAVNNPHWKKLAGSVKSEEAEYVILGAMLLAREMGFSPMQAVSGGINIIQGKFEISARLMNQAIRARGHRLQVKTMSDEVCVIWGKRKDTGEDMEINYHIEEARRSGLVRDGSPWKKTPQDMLFARAISRLARRLFPDCIGVCFVEGELQEAILKQSPESIEMPKKDEIELVVEPLVNLSLPEDVNTDHVEEFIQETATQTKRSGNDIRKRASENLEGFLKSFRQWAEKHYPPIQEDSLFELQENVG